MTPHDRYSGADNGGDGERVVVRDRRRIDPTTGEVRTPGEAPSPGAAPGPAGSGTDAPSPDAAVSEEAAALTAEVAERTADLQRVTAEYANYRRRVDRDREAVLVGAKVQFVAELLTVLDDLDRAAAHGDLTGAFKSVGDKVVGIVTRLGLEAFGAAGEPFDPAMHEAVQHEQSEVSGPSETVLAAVLRPGYRLADRVLRPAMVTVTDRAAREQAPPAPDAPADPGPAEGGDDGDVG